MTPATKRDVTRVIMAGLAVLALLTLADWADLLMPALQGDNGPGQSATDQGGLDGLMSAIDAIRGPATAAFAGVSALGLLAGGAMAGMGMPQGIRAMTMSGLAGAGVLLGNGIIL